MAIWLFIGVFLPGFLIAAMTQQKRHVLMLSVPFSLSAYVALAFGGEYLGITRWVFPLYFLGGGGLIVAAALLPTIRRKIQLVFVDTPEFFLILLVVVIYHYFTGAFIDYGVDLFRHMALSQTVFRSIAESGGELYISLRTGTENLLFHNITAYYRYLTGLAAAQVIEDIAVVYAFFWSLGMYLFSNRLLATMRVEGRALKLLSLVAVLLYWFTYGINNFSYPRYYVGGPSILNFTVYIALLVLLLEMWKHRLSLTGVFTCLALSATAAILHPQEILLVVASVFSLSLVIIVSRLLGQKSYVDFAIDKHTVVLGWLVALATMVLVFVAIYKLPKYDPDPISLLNLGTLNQRFSAWNILRPDHQFYTTLGLWGLFVVSTAIVFWRRFFSSAIVISILLLPLVTVFNPVFSEAVMKAAYPQVLWRLLLSMHLPVVVCFLIWTFVSSWGSTAVRTKILALVCAVPLTGLLLPFQFGPINNSLVRYPSLTRTPVENSHHHWHDLIDYLNSLPSTERVLTDPVTSYAVRSLTPHISYGHKFFPRRYYKQINFPSYENNPLGQYAGSLLVVNRRDGAVNTRLQPPYHIYPDVMAVAKYYSPPLLEEVGNQRDRYKLLWSSDNINVYRIR